MRHRQKVPRGRPPAHPNYNPSFIIPKRATDPDEVNTHGLPVISGQEYPDNGVASYPRQPDETLVQDDFDDLRAADPAIACPLMRSMLAHGPHDEYTHEAAKRKRL